MKFLCIKFTILFLYNYNFTFFQILCIFKNKLNLFSTFLKLIFYFSTQITTHFSVLIGTNSPLQRQSLLLNRSMDALNERIIHYTAGQMPQMAYAADPYQVYGHQQPSSSNSARQQSAMRGTLGRNWRVRTPVIMPREYVVDPGPLYSARVTQLSQQDQRRYRAKSLDNANRFVYFWMRKLGFIKISDF